MTTTKDQVRSLCVRLGVTETDINEAAGGSLPLQVDMFLKHINSLDDAELDFKDLKKNSSYRRSS